MGKSRTSKTNSKTTSKTTSTKVKASKKQKHTTPPKEVTEESSIPEYNASVFKNNKIELIQPEDFSKDNMIHSSLATNAYGGKKILFRYYNPKTGNFCKPALLQPEQEGYPIRYKWAQNTKPADVKEYEVKDFANVTGVELKVDITSRETVDNPTPEEAEFKRCLQEIQEFTYQALEDEMFSEHNVKEELVNENVWNPHSLKKLRTGSLVRPVISPGLGYNPDGKTPKEKFYEDPSKPENFRAKFNAWRKTDKTTKKPKELAPGEFSLNVQTVIHGAGNRPLNVMDCAGKRGIYRAVLVPDNIFVGAHGSLPFQASTQIKVHEMNFTESSYERESFIQNDYGANDLPENEGVEGDMSQFTSGPSAWGAEDGGQDSFDLSSDDDE